nr:Ig-like domain-containing protein [Akkermansiaceae bacterium]
MRSCRIHLICCFVLLVIFPGSLHALTATALFPANNATSVSADTPLKITFDTAPTLGTSGAVRIYNSSGTLVETLDLAVAHTRTIGGTLYNAYPILISGTTASIFPRSGVL